MTPSRPGAYVRLDEKAFFMRPTYRSFTLKEERMTQYEAVSTGSEPPGRSEAQMDRCRLFNDVVSEHLCVLRRQELDSKGGFSCEGCSCSWLPGHAPEAA